VFAGKCLVVVIDTQINDMKKFTALSLLTLLGALAGPTTASAATTLAQYTFGTVANPTTAATTASGVTASAFGSVGVTGSALTGNGNPPPQYAATGWSGNTATPPSKYFDFTITILSGETVSLSTLNLDTLISKSGGNMPTTFDVFYVIGAGNATSVETGISTGTTTWSSVSPINLSGISALQDLSSGSSVSFWFAGRGATGSSDGWGVDNVTLAGLAVVPEPVNLALPVFGLCLAGAGAGRWALRRARA